VQPERAAGPLHAQARCTWRREGVKKLVEVVDRVCLVALDV